MSCKNALSFVAVYEDYNVINGRKIVIVLSFSVGDISLEVLSVSGLICALAAFNLGVVALVFVLVGRKDRSVAEREVTISEVVNTTGLFAVLENSYNSVVVNLEEDVGALGRECFTVNVGCSTVSNIVLSILPALNCINGNYAEGLVAFGVVGDPYEAGSALEVTVGLCTGLVVYLTVLKLSYSTGGKSILERTCGACVSGACDIFGLTCERIVYFIEVSVVTVIINTGCGCTNDSETLSSGRSLDFEVFCFTVEEYEVFSGSRVNVVGEYEGYIVKSNFSSVGEVGCSVLLVFGFISSGVVVLNDYLSV